MNGFCLLRHRHVRCTIFFPAPYAVAEGSSTGADAVLSVRIRPHGVVESSARKEVAMDLNCYSIDQLVADLRQISSESNDERHILSRGRTVVRRAALSKAIWAEGRMYRADPTQGFGVHLLHEEHDHALAVLAVSWLPNHGTPPHNHGTWALVAAVDGPERNDFFERVDDGSRPGYAELKKIGEKRFEPGEVIAMPSSTIHSVWNDSDKVTLSLHVYGKHINFTGRSQFDLETRTETPFILAIER
jgi:predicted metal-dependent enzyme (double-stranded beta helix superfamily)